MKEGRMKGQAFVSFADEKSAELALKETNCYVLFGKPLVVVSLFLLFYGGELNPCIISIYLFFQQFARSAKPKT